MYLQRKSWEELDCPNCGQILRHDFGFNGIGFYIPLSEQRVTCPGCQTLLEWEIDPWVDQGGVVGWTPYLHILDENGQRQKSGPDVT